MGFTPQQVGQMSFWQFHCAVAGVIRSRQDPSKAPSPEPSDRLKGLFTDKEAW